MSNEPKHPLIQELSSISSVVELPIGRKENRQLFEGGVLSQDSKAMEYYGRSDALFGDKPPNLQILHERPEHRLIVYLKAQGMTNKEVADKTGYGYQWVCQITRQPWFRQRFIEECAAAGQDAVKCFLEGEVIPSLETLRDIRDNPHAKDASRVSASNSILDRFLGKPTQKVETSQVTDNLDDARAEVADLERQVSELRKQNGLEESQPSTN